MPAAALRQGGVAVVRVGADAAAVLRRADALAATLHEHTPLYVRRGASVLFPELGSSGGARGLAGYNEPSPAKAVFRVRRGQCQPWPDEEEAGPALHGFRDAQLAAMAVLEGVADLCLAALDGDSGGRWRLLAQFGTDADAWDDSTSLSLSPYDLFYYHNDARAAGHINCHEHVDPGILTCVPCAAVPGLELVRHGDRSWWAAEAHGPSDAPALEPLRDVLVFANSTLATVTDGDVPAVVHRVSKAARPRRSMVYERRPSARWLVGRAQPAASAPSTGDRDGAG